ncbi:MAG: chloramphenicol O-acetyltransferase type [Acidobacteriota bacterium]|jgi:chloramphenicol O-acetyltransferase type A|nr:chloramphenicol O-acetyltransferase type [Acidobacteriota bacterium]
MARYLDTETWHRRRLFQFFKGYDDPFFNICAEVDISPLLDFTRAQNLSSFITYHFLSIKSANDVEPFRYRLRGDRVLIHDRIHAGATLLLADESFTFVYFDYTEDFEAFHSSAKATIESARVEVPSLDARDEQDDLIYHSVIPWVSFTSISHARDSKRQNSVPKISFGKYRADCNRIKMPVSVEVHHALMDGLHVGRYFERLEGYISNPRSALVS